MESLKKHHISFKNAFNGINWAFTTQPNFKVHLSLSFLVIILGMIYKISYIEVTILMLVIVMGLVTEMVNTSIEAMTDLISTEWKKEAKIAKDVSAGMMLLIALGAIFIASLIFIPKMLK